MKLKSFGCSFIFGTDLSDGGKEVYYASGSRLTWPALVAQQLGLEYETHARPGSGNLQILERLLNHIEPDTVYVVAWTWIDRFDYVDPEHKMPWPGTKWLTLMPTDQDTVANQYYRHVHSEYQDKLTTLMCMHTAIQHLRDNHCRFIMTYMDHLTFCQQWNHTPGMMLLQQKIKPYMSDFQGENFLDWSRQRGFEISHSAHPLETAHSAAADLVTKNLDAWIRS